MIDLRDRYGRFPSPADLTSCGGCGQAIRRDQPDPCPDCRASADVRIIEMARAEAAPALATLASRERARVTDHALTEGGPSPAPASPTAPE